MDFVMGIPRTILKYDVIWIIEDANEINPFSAYEDHKSSRQACQVIHQGYNQTP